MKKILLQAMYDMFQKNIVCNYLLKTNTYDEYIQNIHSVDAYMKAYELFQERKEDVPTGYSSR